MYVGAWQEFHAHKSRVNPKGATQKESVRGISKREIKKALMNSLDPNAVDKVLQAMEPLLEKSPEQSPSKEDMVAAARGPRVVDFLPADDLLLLLGRFLDVVSRRYVGVIALREAARATNDGARREGRARAPTASRSVPLDAFHRV